MKVKKDCKKAKETFSNKLDLIFILITIVLLFCISNSINILGISQPKIIGIFFTVSLFILLIRNKFKLKDIKKKSFENLLCLGLIIFAITTLISVFLNEKTQITNIFEIIRPIIYAFSFMSFTYVFKKKENIKFFNKLLLYLIGFLFIINIVQFYNIGNINDLYIKIIAPTQYSTLINNYPWPRIVGLVSNPNVYGLLLSLFNVYVIYLLLNEKEKNKKILFFIIILIIKISLFLTGSRSGYVAMIFSEFFLVFFQNILTENLTFFSKVKKAVIPCLILLIVEVSLLFILPLKYNWRIRELFSGNIRTFEMRKETSNIIINEHLNIEDETTKSKEEKNEVTEEDPSKSNESTYYSESDKEKIKEAINPEFSKKTDLIKKTIVGVGPIKENIIIECEWIKIFVFYGIIGLVSFLLIYSLPLFNIKKLSKKFVIYYLAIILSYFVYMIVSGAFFSHNLFISILLFVSLGYCNEIIKK